MVKDMKKTYLFGVSLAILFFSFNVNAKEIDTNMGVVQAMDKITGRVSTIEIPVGGEVSFGDFEIKLKSCKTTPPEEAPENFAFINIIENLTGGKTEEIFNGWMISSSPALHEVQHPVYDVWLIKCMDGDLSKFERKEEEKELPEQIDVKKEEIKIEEVKPAEQKEKDNKVEVKPVTEEIKEVKVEAKSEVATEDKPIELKEVIEAEEQVVYSGTAKEESLKEEEKDVVYQSPQKVEVITVVDETTNTTSEVVYGVKEKKAE
jgi:hypothetical protein